MCILATIFELHGLTGRVFIKPMGVPGKGSAAWTTVVDSFKLSDVVFEIFKKIIPRNRF